MPVNTMARWHSTIRTYSTSIIWPYAPPILWPYATHLKPSLPRSSLSSQTLQILLILFSYLFTLMYCSVCITLLTHFPDFPHLTVITKCSTVLQYILKTLHFITSSHILALLLFPFFSSNNSSSPSQSDPMAHQPPFLPSSCSSLYFFLSYMAAILLKYY